MKCNHQQLIKAIQAELRPEDLRGSYRDRAESGCPVEGHCALAAETLQALLWECGERQWKARVAKNKTGETHWWLESPTGEILDPTVEQFYYYGEEPPYAHGRPAGFQGTRWVEVDGQKQRRPSAAAMKVLQRMRLPLAKKIVQRFQGKLINTASAPSVEQIVTSLRQLYPHQRACEINQGDCRDFAEDLLDNLEATGYDAQEGHTDIIEEDLWGEGWEYRTDRDAELPVHMWVEVNGRAYDAESPQGVDRWWKLPLFQRFFQQYPEAKQVYVMERPVERFQGRTPVVFYLKQG